METDLLKLYQRAVQDPRTQAQVMSIIYQRLRGREAQGLREDFAGTAADSIAWVAAGPQRRAVAVEIDRPTAQWAMRSARRCLGHAIERIQIVNEDVLAAGPPRLAAADILIALNFSVFLFHDRGHLLEYLRHARSALADEGVLVINAFGGPGAMRKHAETRRIAPVTGELAGGGYAGEFAYQWEQREYDAATNRVDCRIHFILPAASTPKTGETGVEELRIADAFRYDFRLWTLPELREALREAGFADAQIWRHTYDPARAGTEGVFLGPVQQIPAADTWVAYVVGLR